MEQWGFKNQQRDWLAQSGLLRNQANNQRIGAGINTATSLLGSSSEIYMRR
jgi:hypothetical protein